MADERVELELEELDTLDTLDETEAESQLHNTSNCTRLDCPCGVANTTELEEPAREQEETGTSKAPVKNYDSLEESSDTTKYHALLVRSRMDGEVF